MSTQPAHRWSWPEDARDIWEAGYDAAVAGRSKESNPYLSGEAELLASMPQGMIAPPGGSTPGSSSARVTDAELREVLAAEDGPTRLRQIAELQRKAEGAGEDSP